MSTIYDDEPGVIGKILGFFSGKKTYLIGLAVIAIGVVEGAFGIDLPGVTVDPTNWVEWVLGGAGLNAVRAALGKVGL